jgi:hypothetical protein
MTGGKDTHHATFSLPMCTTMNSKEEVLLISPETYREHTILKKEKDISVLNKDRITKTCESRIAGLFYFSNQNY